MVDHNVLQSIKLSLLFTEYCELDSSWNYKNILSPFSRLYLISAGEGEIFMNNKVVKLLPDNLYLIPSFTQHNISCSDFIHQYYICFVEDIDCEIDVYNFVKCGVQCPASSFDYLLFKRLLELNPDMQLPAFDPQKYDNSPVIYSKQTIVNNQPENDFMETQGIILQLFSRFVNKQTSADIEKRNAMMRISGVLQYINKNLQQNLTLEDLSNHMFLSPDYFSRMFSKVMGESPIEYVIRKRIEKAQELLFFSSEKIQTISEQCGFNNLSNFNKMFKRTTSMKPSEYRQRFHGGSFV
jgi:AraC-type DNA-binding domain-containing proteins